jgi:predicted glycosyltransferase
MAGLTAERSGIVSATLLRLRPHVFLVDHAPLGIKGELRLALEMAREELGGTRTVIGLRDIVDDSAVVRRTWKEQDIYGVLEHFYDQILIYGSRELYDVTSHYGFSDALAERTIFAGYIAKDRSLEPRLAAEAAWPHALRAGDVRILVMGGGGADAEPLFGAFLDAWPDIIAGAPGQALLVMGPLMPAVTATAIEKRVADASAIEIIRDSKSMLSLISTADAVVSMGGYNSVVEVVSALKPLVICPRESPRKEQLVRARVIAELGLARVVRIDREGSRSLARAVLQAIEDGPPPASALRGIDLGGADRVAELLLAEHAPALAQMTVS